MELFPAIMFRADNTDDSYSEAMITIFNRALADRIAHLEDGDTDAAYQIAKSFADEVNNRPRMFDDPAWLRSTLYAPTKE
jgi:hypothetical protein